MKLVAARRRARRPQRPGRDERHLAIADHEPAALHDDWHREHAGHRPHVAVQVGECLGKVHQPAALRIHRGRPERAKVFTAARIGALAASSRP